MKGHPHRWLAVLATCLALAGCGVFRGNSDPGPRFVGAGDAAVRPGDRLALRIWNEPEMTDTFNVAENGKVVLPKLGAIEVANQSVVSLQDSVRVAYSEFLRNPSVEITVLRRVGVSGAVREPGIFLVDLTMALPDVIAQAGGLVEGGEPNDVTVVRGGERLHFSAEDRERFVAAELQSGDQVVIGYKNFIKRNPLAVITTAVPLLGYVVGVIIPALKDL